MDNKSISKTVTFGSKVYEEIERFAEKYFQGNLSAATCFIIVRYFELDDMNNTATNKSSNENSISKKNISKHHLTDLDVLLKG